MKRLVQVLFGVAALAVATTALTAGKEARTITWEDLTPDDWQPFDPYLDLSQDQLRMLLEGSPEQQQLMRKFAESKMSAPVVGELDEQRVRIPGFVVPMEFDRTEVTEFLLVPYVGACIHVPPPPSNQVVYVTSNNGYAVEELFDPVWVTGTITTEMFLNELGDAGYTLLATDIEPYQYE